MVKILLAVSRSFLSYFNKGDTFLYNDCMWRVGDNNVLGSQYDLGVKGQDKIYI